MFLPRNGLSLRLALNLSYLAQAKTMSGNQPSGVDNYRAAPRSRSYSERCRLNDRLLQGGEPLAAPTSCMGIWEDNQGSTVSTWGQMGLGASLSSVLLWPGWDVTFPDRSSELTEEWFSGLMHCFPPASFPFVCYGMGKEARAKLRMLVC